MHKEALAFPPEGQRFFLLIHTLFITYDKQYFVTLRVKYLISNSMSESKRIKTALVSVYHKEGLDEIITKLHEEGVEFLSTGGTRQFIESLGYPCKAVEDLTTYPSILGGRVKTLHPKIFGGILCRRGLEQDMQQIEKYEIPEIDLVIVDLYPFEATVALVHLKQILLKK